MTRKELKKIFDSKKEKIVKGNLQAGFKKSTFEDFENWFSLETFEKGCHYCGTTNQTSYRLFVMQRNGERPDATRGGKRSKRLELDRLNAFEHYDNLANIVWCCYWCNNAKSNFFSENEFRPIAKAIGEALQKI